MPKRKLRVDEDGNVRDEGGDVIAQFMNERDATLFTHAPAMLEELKRCYAFMLMPMTNSRTKHYLSNDLNVVIARAEGKCP